MNYNIKTDSIFLRELYNLSQDNLANELQVDKITINRIENGETYPREELMNNFYNYFYKQKLNFNIQKEKNYRDRYNCKSNHILLTHASKNGIDGEISPFKGRENNDFGLGFYCGDSYDKAIAFVCRFKDSCVYFIDFDKTGLKEVKFDVTTEWMIAIAWYRGTLDKYLDKYKNNRIIKSIIKKIQDADYIIAPIADNRMFQIIDTFIAGEITDEQCKHCLAATNLGMQYVFKTKDAINQLCVLERCFVPSLEKEYYKKEQIKYQKDGEDKSKIARIEYRGKGKYIDEILKG